MVAEHAKQCAESVFARASAPPPSVSADPAQGGEGARAKQLELKTAGGDYKGGW